MLNSLKLQIEMDLESAIRTYAFANSPASDEVLKAHIYPISAGGKRVRPLLLRLTAACLGGAEASELARVPATALECVHTYSLVHDDLPCMDNDDLRRGKPTSHKVFGEAKALLVGDGLLTMAFAMLADISKQQRDLGLECIKTLTRASGAQGMIHGQWLDLSFPDTTKKVLWDDVVLMHRLKTGELFAASFAMGVLCAQASRWENLEAPESWIKLGYDLGLCFQVIDDILDETQPSTVLGKTAGKDTTQNKFTTVKMLGLERAKAFANELSQQCVVELERLLPKPPLGDEKSNVILLEYFEELTRRKY